MSQVYPRRRPTTQNPPRTRLRKIVAMHGGSHYIRPCIATCDLYQERSMRTPFTRAASLVILLGLTVIVRGEDKPAAAAPPAENAGVTIGEMRIQTVPALTYLYTTAETSFDKMSEPIVSAFGKIVPVARQGKILLAHPT